MWGRPLCVFMGCGHWPHHSQVQRARRRRKLCTSSIHRQCSCLLVAVGTSMLLQTCLRLSLCAEWPAMLQIAYAASDEVLVTGGYDQAIRLWDCRSRSFEPIQTMKNFGDAVTSVSVADGYSLQLSQHIKLSPVTWQRPTCVLQPST